MFGVHLTKTFKLSLILDIFNVQKSVSAAIMRLRDPFDVNKEVVL